MFSCYESFDKWEEIVENARFAIESVSLPTLGTLGLLANAIVIFVLFRIVARKDVQGNQKNFDKLVICLSFIDSFLIVIYIVDALIQIDILHEPQWYQVISETVSGYNHRILFLLWLCVNQILVGDLKKILSESDLWDEYQIKTLKISRNSMPKIFMLF